MNLTHRGHTITGARHVGVAAFTAAAGAGYGSGAQSAQVRHITWFGRHAIYTTHRSADRYLFGSKSRDERGVDGAGGERSFSG